jgi:hypothetical protein
MKMLRVKKRRARARMMRRLGWLNEVYGNNTYCARCLRAN